MMSYEKSLEVLRELDKLRCAYGNVCDNAARTEKKVKWLEEALERISKLECLAEHPDDCVCCLSESDAVEIAKQALNPEAK